MIRILGFALALLGCIAAVQAQDKPLQLRQKAKDECQNHLSLAEAVLEKGEILKALELIEDCALHAQEMFSPEDGLRALRLLAILYNETRQTQKAEQTMRTLLHRYPRFVPSEQSEKYQLVTPWSQYRVFPGLQFSVVGGAMLPRLHSLKTWQVTQGTSSAANLDSSFKTIGSGSRYDTLNLSGISTETKKYKPLPSFSYGINLTATVLPRLSVEAGAVIHEVSWIVDSTNKYYAYFTQPGPLYAAPTEGIFRDIWAYRMWQKLRYQQLQVGLRWDLLTWYSPIRPYVEGGAGWMHLQSAQRLATQYIYESGIYSSDSMGGVALAGVPVATYPKLVFQTSNISWYGGAGVALGRKDISFKAGIRAGGIIGNIVNSNNRYRDEIALFQFYHLEDDLTLKWLSLQAALVYTIRYNVREKHKHQPKIN